jgi:xylulokinase
MEVINSTQAGTLGAAILAASAVQLNMKITDIVKDMVQVKKCFKPRSQYHRLYMERYDSYKQLYNDVGVKRYFAP